MKKIIFLLALQACFLQLIYCQNEPVVHYKNRIGLDAGGGTGFQFIKAVTLSDGTDGSISFGAGTFVSFEYGYEFSKYFDLAISAGGQFSKLDKDISNGSMTFDRSILSVTPSYMLPIKGGEKMRIKFGLGIDWIYNGILSFDLSKISGGTKDDWKYKNTVGEHISIIYEINIINRLSMDLGFRLHNAKFNFKSGGHSYPTDDFKNPEGSGADFIFGAYYNFNWKKQ